MPKKKVPLTFEKALAELHVDDMERRENALRRIEELAEGQLSSAQVATLIRAAATTFPPSDNEWRPYDEALLETSWDQLRAEHIAVIVEQYPKFSQKGRPAALTALSRLQTREAVLAFVQLLREHGWPADSSPAMTLPFTEECPFADELLPPLVDGSIQGVPPEERDQLLVNYAEKRKLVESVAAAAKPEALQRARETVKTLAPLQQSSGIGWRWHEDYHEQRIHAGLLLELLGYLGRDKDLITVLQKAAALADPHLRLYATLSLLRLGEKADPKALLAVAQDAETRGTLFKQLSELQKRDLFPQSELTQEKLAESDMVSWLAFPTELSRAPDRIELMDTVEVDAGNRGGGVFVYYLFRFMTEPPHWAADDGWMAGVSGPFRKAEFPTLEGWGDTFSTFSPWDDFTPEEHLSSIRDLMERWHNRHSAP